MNATTSKSTNMTTDDYLQEMTIAMGIKGKGRRRAGAWDASPWYVFCFVLFFFFYFWFSFSYYSTNTYLGIHYDYEQRQQMEMGKGLEMHLVVSRAPGIFFFS